MAFFVILAGVLQIAYGAVVVAIGQTGFHAVTASVAIGLGVLCVAAGAGLVQMGHIRRIIEDATSAPR